MFFSFLLLCVFFATDSCVKNMQGLFCISHGVYMQPTNEQILNDFIRNGLHVRNQNLSAGAGLLFSNSTLIARQAFNYFEVKMFTGKFRICRETEKSILKLVCMLKERGLNVAEITPCKEEWQHEKMHFKKMLKEAARGY